MSDLHGLAPEEVRRQVRSFQFWLDSVRDYIPSDEGATLPADDIAEEDRDALITVLCTYCVGEMMALEGAGGLIRRAPNRDAKIFLSTQTVDEGRHLEVLTQRMVELGVEDVDFEIEQRANPYLVEFRERLLDLVEEGTWESALFVQNVLLESMEFAAFCHHMESADARTRALLDGIVKDERRHMGFGENELGRSLAHDPSLRGVLDHLRPELDFLVQKSFEHTTSQLDVPAPERHLLQRNYLAAVRRLGFE